VTGAGEPKAAVYDLGYQRYAGARRPQRWRHRVIARNLIASAWQGWLRMKLPVLGTAGIVAIAGGIIYWATYIVDTIGVPQRIADEAGGPLSMIDFVIPGAFDAFTFVAFIFGLTVGGGVVANDLRAGAFEFYFARPIRPADYVTGKLLGVAAIVGIATLAGPVVLALVRIAFSSASEGAASSLHLLPKAIAAGIAATAVYSVVPLAWSAIAARPGYTIAAWAAFYIVFGIMITAIAQVTSTPALGALHVKLAVMSIVMNLFEVPGIGPMFEGVSMPPLWAAVLSVAAYTAGGIAFIHWRVARAERRGLGGG
jgi:ABC-type transport system involved in multi-copper enzyme maturation permease subunit